MILTEAKKPGIGWPEKYNRFVDDVMWLPSPSAPNYEVSSDGRVRSLTRIVTYPNGSRRRFDGRERTVFLVKGYQHLNLSASQGKKKNFYVHLLVCEAFQGPRPSPVHEVRHLDGDPLNNRADNLAWGTKQENAQDSIRHGTNKERNKTHCKYGHPFDEENTMMTKRARLCRACRRREGKRYYEATRERARVHKHGAA